MEKLSRFGFESLSNEDIENLPEGAIKKLPAIESLARGLSGHKPLELGRQTATMMLEFILLDLKYYLEIPTGKSSPDFVAAVKEFQKSIGAKPTGELLMGELDALSERSELVRPPKVRPLMLPSVDYYGDSARVDGSWVAQDATKDWLLTTSTIELNRNGKRGVEAMAMYWDFWRDGKATLGVTINHWEILRWNDDEIIAEASRSTGPSRTLTVDIKGRKARIFERPPSGNRDESKSMIFELSNGWQASTAISGKNGERSRYR